MTPSPANCPGCETALLPNTAICPSCGQDVEKLMRFDEHMERGRTLEAAGEHEAAAIEFEAAQALFPLSRDTASRLTGVRKKSETVTRMRPRLADRDLDAALEAARAILDINAGDSGAKQWQQQLLERKARADAEILRAQKLIYAQDYAAAIDVLKALLAEGPYVRATEILKQAEDRHNRRRFHLGKADRMIEEGRCDAALAELTLAESVCSGEEIESRRALALKRRRRNLALRIAMAAGGLLVATAGVLGWAAYDNNRKFRDVEDLLKEAKFSESRPILDKIGWFGVSAKRVERFRTLVPLGEQAVILERRGFVLQARDLWIEIEGEMAGAGIASASVADRKEYCLRKIEELYKGALSRAETRLKGRGFKRALNSCEEALRMKPGDQKAQELKNRVLIAMKRAPETFEVLHEVALGPESRGSVSMSPDGTIVIVATTNALQFISPDDGSNLRSIDTVTRVMGPAVVRPDGKELAWAGSNGRISVAAVDPPSTRLLRDPKTGAPRGLAYDENGTHLTVWTDTEVSVWDLATGTSVTKLRPDKAALGRLTRDGKLLAIASSEGTIILWEVTEGKLRTSIKPAPSPVSLAFTRDGSTLASGSSDGTIQLWDTSSGRLLATMWAQSGRPEALAFNPEGSILVAAPDGLYLQFWDVHSRKVLDKLHNRGTSIVSADFTPDGLRLITGHFNGHVTLWGYVLPLELDDD